MFFPYNPDSPLICIFTRALLRQNPQFGPMVVMGRFARTGLGGAVGCASDWRPGGRGFDPRRGRQHSFVEIDHEIFYTVILSLPLIQEGQLSVSGERMCTILVNRLED